MAGLKPGTKIKLKNSAFPDAEIVRILGEGGQGTVYEVNVGGKPHALKWYHVGKLKNKDAFRKNLRANIEDAELSMAANKKFLWPKYLTEEHGGAFGYVMDIRPKEYTDFPAILNAKDKKGKKIAFQSTDVMILAALNLVNAFRELHRKGLSYQDLNDGNFFINITNGDVLICDNDNVTPDRQENAGGVGGKPGYMAPEIVRGEAKPSERSDCHSLAVVLFKLFFRDNPLQGAEFEKIPCLTEKREMELFGTKPVFVYDPDDASNRPVQGVHANVIALWPRFPQFFRDAFIESFAKGMKNPQLRLVENDWQKILVRLRDEWTLDCPSCGKKMIFTEQLIGKQMTCSGCKSNYSYPKILTVKKLAVPLFPGKKLYACHTDAASDDYAAVTAEVVMNKNNPSLWGIKNLSPDLWKLKTPEGDEKEVPPQGGVPIGAGVSVILSGVTGVIEEKAI
jgi:DNA-binding helix-hairpin-helix protein with protein kinase domain